MPVKFYALKYLCLLPCQHLRELVSLTVAFAEIPDCQAFVGFSSICQFPARQSGILVLLEAFSENI